jgi:hypothetical protein
MFEIVEAIYEGKGLVRLQQELKGVKPQEHLTVLVLPTSASKELPIQKLDIEALQQQLQTFEKRYSLKTAEFYTRFLRGEMGDERDFIVWAGLQELLQRMTATANTS